MEIAGKFGAGSEQLLNRMLRLAKIEMKKGNNLSFEELFDKKKFNLYKIGQF